MDNQVTTSNNNEITEEGAMPSSSTTSGSNINYEGTTSSNENKIKEDMNSTSNNNDIKEGMNSTSKNNEIKEGMKSTSNNNDMNEDHVTLFVAYNGKWEYDRKEWFFEKSKSSIMVVPKYITLSEITEILHKQLKVNKFLYRLKLEVHYRTGSPWFPVTEIQNDQDLSVFISETSKTKLPLCVTRIDDDEINSDDDEERQKDHRILVAYNGKWRWDSEKWLFENSEGSIMVDVSKYVTLWQITTRLYRILDVDPSSYDLKLEVHYRCGSPCIIEIDDDDYLSEFIFESSKTELPLCVTRVAKGACHGRKCSSLYDRVENRLFKAIQNNDWVKAREIVNTKEVTWTSKLDKKGFTALHFAVGRYKDNEVFRDIVMGINSELLVTTVNNYGKTPAHTAANLGNTEALKIMLDSNPECLFILDEYGLLPIHETLVVPAINTFRYLFKEMKSKKYDFDIFFSGMHGPYLLQRVIDTGIIDVAYELINDYPSLATTVHRDKTALDCIIRKPDLFYSGTSYSFYSRSFYNIVPIENKSLGGTNTADVENQTTPRKRSLHDVISRIYVKLWETTLLHVPHVKHLRDDKVKHKTTIKLLRRICEEADRTYTLSDIERLVLSPFFFAVENNTIEVVDVLTTYFKGLGNYNINGVTVYQLTVLNRSEKVYSSLINNDNYFAKSELSAFLDNDGNNNILHLAGHLAPIHKLNAASGAALQMQRELQWFEEVKKRVQLAHTLALNDNKETPMMVFRRKHKKLRNDGEEWMKKTADSYTITAALIITIVFAAAITVPGGNDDKTGKPIYESKASLIIFAISDAISLFTATNFLVVVSINSYSTLCR